MSTHIMLLLLAVSLLLFLYASLLLSSMIFIVSAAYAVDPALADVFAVVGVPASCLCP